MLRSPAIAVFVLSFSIAPVGMAGKTFAPDASEVTLAAEELGLELHHLLAAAPEDEKSAIPFIGLDDLEHRLDLIAEAAAGVSDAETRVRLNAKINQIRGLLYNLRLVANNPSVALELPTGAEPSRKWTLSEAPPTTLAPANNGCSNPTSVGLGTWFGETVEASNDGAASCGASMFSPDVWYRFTAPYDGIFYATTAGSGFDTVLSSHSVCPGTVANEIECNDDNYGLWSSIRIDADAGDEVLIRIAGAGGTTGSYQLTIATDARISGRITAADGGDPLVDYRAKAYTATGALVGSSLSDTNGDYEISGLNQAEYFVGIANGNGDFLHELYDDISCPQGVPYDCDPTGGFPVTTSLGAVTAGIDFILDRESVVTGTVTALPDGQPIASTRVKLYDDTGTSYWYGYADQFGNYEFRGLKTGTYFVFANHDYFVPELWDNQPCPEPPPYGCDALDGDPVSVPVATTVGGIDFELQKKGAITGVVTEESTGLPVVGASVEAIGPGYESYYATTGADGSYIVEGLKDGTNFLTVSHNLYFGELYDGFPCEDYCDVTAGTPISVTVGATTSGIDVDLVPLGQISGMVTEVESGVPLAFVKVRAQDATHDSNGSDFTDESGLYTISGLLAGDHYVWTDADSHANLVYNGIDCHYSCDLFAGTPVQVSLAATSNGVNFELEPTGGISGTVTDAGTGSPLQSTYVRVWHGSLGDIRENDYTNSSGEYEVFGLAPGPYFVLTQEGEPYLDELFDGYPCLGGPLEGCDPTKGTPVIVAAGEITWGVHIALMNLEDVVFIDGFESGGTGAWTATEPF